MRPERGVGVSMNNVIQLNQPQQAGQIQLPETYENAKRALSVCVRMDECKDWADKAAALASYARQSNDKTLEKLAARIRARAIRRCGELLRQVEPANGARTDLKPRGGCPPRLSRKAAATEAGLSTDQMKTALRIANVPAEEFEALVESEDPPGADKIAERGKKTRGRVNLDGMSSVERLFRESGDYRDESNIRRAINFIGPFSEFVEKLGKIKDIDAEIENLLEWENRELINHIKVIINSLSEIKVKLEDIDYDE